MLQVDNGRNNSEEIVRTTPNVSLSELFEATQKCIEVFHDTMLAGLEFSDSEHFVGS